jgi:hypothetical protein
MTFVTPAHISDALTDRIRTRLLNQAYRQAEAAQEYVRTEKRPRGGFAPLLAVETDHYCQTVRFVNIDFRTIKRITEDSVKNATDLLEDRVNRNIGEGEELRHIDLTIQQTDLITGSVEGMGWHIDVQMLWNYRYGENSANGVLTVYPQFRGTRHGLPMAGKPQQSKATAEKEAAKAERQAAKVARRAELRAKFAKAPARLIKKLEKDVAGCRERFAGYERLETIIAEDLWMIERLQALTVEELDARFDKGDRTSGDIESFLERQYRAQRKATA